MSIKSIDERLAGYQPLWENWFLDSLIYNGANSRVYKIKRNRDGEDEYAAMKAVSITLDNDLFISGDDSIKYLDDRCKNAKAEIKNMIKLQRSPYIVSYYDDVTKEILDDTGTKCGYDILIRMEYLDCFGSKIRKKEIPVTTQDVLNLAYDIGSALLDVHKNKMIHRDIKPDNIFIDQSGYYKLGDLGVTKSINASGYASTRTGTEPYAAPEVWRSESYTQSAYTYKADIYSFGLVLYQLMNNNYLPFMSDFTHNELEKSISMRMRGEKISPPANGSERFKQIICRMCEFNPDDRFSDMSEFLNSLSEVGKRSDSDAQSDDLELNPGNPADQIPTLDANEGCAVYKQIDENPSEVDIGTYMPVVGANTAYVNEYLPPKTSGSVTPEQISAAENTEFVNSEHTSAVVNNEPVNSEQTSAVVNNESVNSEQTSAPVNNEPVNSEQTSAAVNNESVNSEQTSAAVNNESVNSEQTSAPVNNESVNSEQTSAPVNNESVNSEQTSTPINNGSVDSEQTNVPENDEPVISEQISVPENSEPVISEQISVPDNNESVNSEQTSAAENNESVNSEQTSAPEQINKPENIIKPVENQQASESSEKKSDNTISEFQTYQGNPSAECDFSEDTVFHTFPAQCAAVNQINAESGKDKKKILSPDGVFRKEDYHRIKVKNGLLVIPKGYFSVAPFTLYKIERDLITQIEIPESVTSFQNNAFRDLTNLKTIKIAGDVMIIRSSLFSGCVSLETVILPLSTRKIEDYAFEGCKSLRSVDARGYITGIGKNAFSGCENVVIKCRENSFMHKYCIKYNIRTEFVDGETGE